MARETHQRHIRHGAYERTSRSKHFRGFIEEEQADLDATGAGATFTGAAGSDATWTGHGMSVGDGPFLLTTTGTLPAGLELNTLYWIQGVSDVNTVQLTTKRGGPAAVMGDAGTGTHTITKASSEEAIYEHLKVHDPKVIRDETDVDNL